MAFNWKAFAAAFMEDQAKQINARVAKADEYEEEMREQFERSKLNYAKRRTFVNKAMSQVANLRRLGATDRMIKAAVANGPETLFTFAEKLTKEAEKSRVDRFTESEIDVLVDMPESFTADEYTLDEFIERSYGLTKPSIGSTARPKRGLFSKAFGIDLKSEVRAQADAEAAYDGYSMLDLNELAKQDVYTSLVPNTSFRITPSIAYRSTDVQDKFNRSISAATKQVTDSTAYKDLFNEPEAQKEMLQKRLAQVVNSYATDYKDKFLNDPAYDLESLIGKKALTAIRASTTGTDQEFADEVKKSIPLDGYGEVKGGAYTFELGDNNEPIAGTRNGQPIPSHLLDDVYQGAISDGSIKAPSYGGIPSGDIRSAVDETLSALGVPESKLSSDSGLPEQVEPRPKTITFKDLTAGRTDEFPGGAQDVISEAAGRLFMPNVREGLLGGPDAPLRFPTPEAWDEQYGDTHDPITGKLLSRTGVKTFDTLEEANENLDIAVPGTRVNISGKDHYVVAKEGELGYTSADLTEYNNESEMDAAFDALPIGAIFTDDDGDRRVKTKERK